MKKLILTIIVLSSVACGKIDVSDSKHKVVHSIDLTDLIRNIESMCRKSNNNELDTQKCINDTFSQVMDALNSNQPSN